MARPALSLEQKQNILQAKQLLRTLWRQSGLKQQDILEILAAEGFELKKNTLSNWLSETEVKRPDSACLGPLLQVLCPHQPTFARLMHDEIERLLGYETLPESSDGILNQLASRLFQGPLSHHAHPLLSMLYELEESIFIYDRDYPVLHIEADDKETLKAALGSKSGKERELYQRYRVSRGYEIPLSKLQSAAVLTQVINSLHQGVRALRAYLEKNLLLSVPFTQDYPLFEELLTYIWEVVNWLLFNPVCQTNPSLKTPLLSIVGTCQGIRYLLESQHHTPSLVAFQNVLQLKGMVSQAEVECSMGVYVGLIARQLLTFARQPDCADAFEKGWKHFEKAFAMLEQHHEALIDERARYFYKKELANLSYDIATLLLWLPGQQAQSLKLMAKAHAYYSQVLESDNLFRASLNQERLAYLQAFYRISEAWCCHQPFKLLERLNQLSLPEQLNDIFWLSHLARAIASGILYLRFYQHEQSQRFLDAAADSLTQAQRVPGMSQALSQEIEQDYILSQLLPRLREMLHTLQTRSLLKTLV